MTAESEGKDAAERFREEHDLGSQPVGDLVTLIEQTVGADVAVLDTEVDQHGMTMRRGDGGRVYIAVAKTPHPMRQRSTLAHELGHVVFDDWATHPRVDSRDPIESRANAFARHLLVPVEGVRNLVAHQHFGSELSMLSTVVQRFLVSPQLAAIALEQAGYISTAAKHEFMNETAPRLAARFGWSDQYQAMQLESDRRRAPQRLLARAISGWLQNVVSIQTIALLRGLDIATVQRELTDAGLAPVAVTPAWSSGAVPPKVDIDLAALDADLSEDGSQ
ncbi:ImmA/IrrE family metallo-endopeptidase [Nocardia amikacinitolerans]|uniref:ImmA/IrrE family metallo-endopeptidase n=1 Tax=Nocardia amikacinitolerans TaxID=756689 RepID=UPI0036BD99BC